MLSTLTAGGLSSITLATDGLIVGAAAVAAFGATGLMPLTSWAVPVVALALIPTAIAYTLGIMGIARPRFASLVGLFEVMFAGVAAWVQSLWRTDVGGATTSGVSASPKCRPVAIVDRQTRWSWLSWLWCKVVCVSTIAGRAGPG
jgi:hypothetical protein